MNRKIIFIIFLLTALFVLSGCSGSKKNTVASRSFYPQCNDNSTKSPCWLKVLNKDRCFVHNMSPLPNESVTWSGKCNNGIAEGEGEEIWYKAGQRTNYYKGELKNGVRHGKGEFHHRTGNIYRGEYKNDLMEGYGEIKFAKAGVYIGYMKSGKMVGKGTLTFKNGLQYKGVWSDGKLNGQATLINPKASSIYTGEMRNSLKHGKGKLVFDNGIVWLTTYKNNKLNGEVIMIKKDGTKIKTVWKNGKLISSEKPIDKSVMDDNS